MGKILTAGKNHWEKQREKEQALQKLQSPPVFDALVQALKSLGAGRRDVLVPLPDLQQSLEPLLAAEDAEALRNAGVGLLVAYAAEDIVDAFHLPFLSCIAGGLHLPMPDLTLVDSSEEER